MKSAARRAAAYALGLALCAASAARAEERGVLLQSTTSTQNSGLYEAILPIFTDTTGIPVRVVAVGTGQALKNAANCDADVVLVHAEQAERDFVAAGYGLARHPVMANDFVLIGPRSDPASVGAAPDLNTALSRLAEGAAPFVSRGDDSGTHKKERALWTRIGVMPDPRGGWYREVGAGMGAALNIAVGMRGYILSDRSTWISFGNKADHTILYDGDPALLNEYGVIQVSPAHCPSVNAQGAAEFIAWLLSPAGQAAIEDFRVAGQPLFMGAAR
ncbi:MAG: substrate-binding domain-containing protein [Alphaproteobacteria bacterium]|nr:substrate-binding domain-containing protein [Alphaproteobacteria bacterium]